MNGTDAASRISQYCVGVRIPVNITIVVVPRYSSLYYFLLNLITINFTTAPHVHTQMSLASESPKNTASDVPEHLRLTLQSFASHLWVARESLTCRSWVTHKWLMSNMWVTCDCLLSWHWFVLYRTVYIKYVNNIKCSILIGYTHVFGRGEYTLYSQQLPYQYDSIMHFTAYQHSLNDQPTIEPLNMDIPSEFLGSRNEASFWDYLHINLLYCDGNVHHIYMCVYIFIYWNNFAWWL